MATGSTVPAVKTAIVSLLTANSALTGVQITNGYPGEANLAPETIYTDDVTGSHRIPVMTAGRKRREETYTLTIVIGVGFQSGDPGDAEARAFVLLQEVEDMVADDPTLGGVSGVIHAIAGGFRETAAPNGEAAACVIEFDIDVLARLA